MHKVHLFCPALPFFSPHATAIICTAKQAKAASTNNIHSCSMWMWSSRTTAEVGCEQFFNLSGYISAHRHTRFKVRTYEHLALLSSTVNKVYIDPKMNTYRGVMRQSGRKTSTRRHISAGTFRGSLMLSCLARMNLLSSLWRSSWEKVREQWRVTVIEMTRWLFWKIEKHEASY